MATARAESSQPSPVEPGSVARSVLDSLLEGCQVIGFDFTYLYVNESVARQAGRTREELLGRPMMSCFPGIEDSPMFAHLRRCMTERTHHAMENEFTFPDGSVGWFELRFVPVPDGACILSIDLTERKHAEAHLARTEDQLRHAQKMEAIGRLAGGVAHDFNNLLTIILSYAALARDEAAAAPAEREALHEIEKAGQRARELTSQLLTISRQQTFKPRVLSINDTLAHVEKMLRRVLGADVELLLRCDPHLGHARLDPGQLEQVLLNLAINARDAMPDGGKLTIETGNVDLDARYASGHLGISPGPHVMLAVSDSGVGMDRETQARIFEPFFTTKPAGKGTGLGLSTVFGIVRQSDGSIWVYSEPGNGTTFKLYFPRVSAAATTPTGSERQTPLPNVPDARVLVVDDDAQVVRVAASILRRAGFDVLTASGPIDAIALVEQMDERLDLLLTDITMPNLSGRRLAQRLRQTRPHLKVLFMSGYTEDAALHQGVLEAADAFVDKPFTPDTLVRAVHTRLQADA
jgi:two-component system, cell cycle sensor histidine kinase and response regulator CckA